MFSIESFISGILNFVNKFVFTFYRILFNSKKFIFEVFAYKLDKYASPGLFFVVSILAFLILVSDFGRGESDVSSESILNISMERKLLYTLPLAGICYFLIFFVGKILRFSLPVYKRFEAMALYWWGATLLAFILTYYLYLLVFYLVFGDIDVFGNWYIAVTIAVHVFVLFKSMRAVSAYYQVKTSLWRKYLMLPVLAAFSTLITYILFEVGLPLLERRYTDSFYVFQHQRSNQELLNLYAVRQKDSIVLQLDLYAANPTSDKIFLDNTEEAYIYEAWTEDYDKYLDYDRSPMLFQDDSLLFLEFRIKKDDSSNQRFILLPPEEVIHLTLTSLIDSNTLKLIEIRQQSNRQRVIRPLEGTVFEIAIAQNVFNKRNKRIRDYFLQRITEIKIYAKE